MIHLAQTLAAERLMPTPPDIAVPLPLIYLLAVAGFVLIAMGLGEAFGNLQARRDFTAEGLRESTRKAIGLLGMGVVLVGGSIFLGLAAA